MSFVFFDTETTGLKPGFDQIVAALGSYLWPCDRAAAAGTAFDAATYNVFTVARHLTSARTHRLFRAEAFATWREAAGICA